MLEAAIDAAELNARIIVSHTQHLRASLTQPHLIFRHAVLFLRIMERSTPSRYGHGAL